MPYSTPVFKNETIDYLVNKFDPSSTILDVGAGAGYYSKLLKGIFPNMDAIEIFEPAKDALYLLENNGIRVKLVGSGSVSKQSLQAGEMFSKGTLITLELI